MAKNDIVIDMHEIYKHEDPPSLQVSFLIFLPLLMRWHDGGTDSSLRHFDRADRTWAEADQGTLPGCFHLHFLALRPSTRNDNDVESGQERG